MAVHRNAEVGCRLETMRMAREGSDLSRLLTVAEVATIMRVSRMTVYRLIRRGQLKAIRVGRNYRVREEDLGEYLDSQAVEEHR
jgi:excisionase family DNA binding protein